MRRYHPIGPLTGEVGITMNPHADVCYFVSAPQSHPDIKWVENAKTLFKVRIHVASTIYAQVQVYYVSSNTADVDL